MNAPILLCSAASDGSDIPAEIDVLSIAGLSPLQTRLVDDGGKLQQQSRHRIGRSVRAVEREPYVLDQELQIHRIAGRGLEAKVFVESAGLVIQGMNEQ